MQNKTPNARFLSEDEFSAFVKKSRQFAFFYGTTKDADGNPVFNKCVIAVGADERQARANTEAKLLGIVGHGGYHIGDLVPIV